MAFCPKCGSQVPDGAKFCGKCGHTMGPRPAGSASPVGTAPAPTPAPQPAATSSVGSEGVKVIGILVAIVVAVALLVVVNPLGCGRAQTEGETAPTPAAPANFEEYLYAIGQYDDWCRDNENELLNVVPFLSSKVLEITYSVSGNEINIEEYCTIYSDEAGLFSSIINAFINELLTDTVNEGFIQEVRDAEAESGLTGITLHYEFRYADGGIITSADYDANGQIR